MLMMFIGYLRVNLQLIFDMVWKGRPNWWPTVRIPKISCRDSILQMELSYKSFPYLLLVLPLPMSRHKALPPRPDQRSECTH